jgi:DNA-binding transcriptional MerR regulator
MARSYLTTSQIARAAGVHPNTVRMYEAWGLIPSVTRTPAGYRRFTALHVDLMRFARQALHGQFPGRQLRRSLVAMVRQAAGGDLNGAMQSAVDHLALVRAEQGRAGQAIKMVEGWAQSKPAREPTGRLQIGQVANLVGVSRDMLRNWESNGLLRVGRDPKNGYRIYSESEIRRIQVIRMLSQAGYSQMAILRMMLQLDQGRRTNLQQVLDTPRPDEDPVSAADRWLSALNEQEVRASQLIEQLQAILAKY